MILLWNPVFLSIFNSTLNNVLCVFYRFCFLHFSVCFPTFYFSIELENMASGIAMVDGFYAEPCALYSAKFCTEINHLKSMTLRKIVGIAFSAGFSDMSEFKHDPETGVGSRRFRFDISVSNYTTYKFLLYLPFMLLFSINIALQSFYNHCTIIFGKTDLSDGSSRV